jgi:hypothetical protein
LSDFSLLKFDNRLIRWKNAFAKKPVGAVRKVRQHFLGWEGSKIEEKVMADSYKKVLKWEKVCKK